MSRLKRAAAGCAVAIAAVASAAPAATAMEPPDHRQCTVAPSADGCVNFTFDAADWSIEVGRHVVDEWVWASDGDRSWCDTYEYLTDKICPPKQWIPAGGGS